MRSGGVTVRAPAAIQTATRTVTRRASLNSTKCHRVEARLNDRSISIQLRSTAAQPEMITPSRTTPPRIPSL